MTCLYCGARIYSLSKVRGVEVSYLETGGCNPPAIFALRFASKDEATDQERADRYKKEARSSLESGKLKTRFEVFGLSPSVKEMEDLVGKAGRILDNPSLTFHQCCNRL